MPVERTSLRMVAGRCASRSLSSPGRLGSKYAFIVVRDAAIVECVGVTEGDNDHSARRCGRQSFRSPTSVKGDAGRD